MNPGLCICSAARGLAPAFGLVAGFKGAAAGGRVPPQYGIDDGGGAAHTHLYRHCFRGAIPAAGAAFHASIPVLNPRTVRTVYHNDVLRADFNTHAAPDALLFVELQCCYIFKINHSSHYL